MRHAAFNHESLKRVLTESVKFYKLQLIEEAKKELEAKLTAFVIEVAYQIQQSPADPSGRTQELIIMLPIEEEKKINFPPIRDEECPF